MRKNAVWMLLAAAVVASVVALAQKAGGTGSAQSQMGPQNPSYVGSLPVREDQGAKAYQALTKVTAEEAVRAAQAALGTTQSPSKVQLGVENGYLVWEVVIGDQEVKVDAGNGQVLHREAVGHEEAREGEGEHEDSEQGEGAED